MNSKVISLFILGVVLTSIFCLSACKKDVEEPELPVLLSDTVIAVKGIVDLPAGSTVSLTGWSVNSGLSTAPVVNDSFNIPQASTSFSLMFALDQNNNERLMGLVYPGQTDYTINSSTTVLAMLMKMPPVISLTEQAQINLINAIKSSNQFLETVQAFESSFLQNTSLFDTTNLVFINSLNSLFEQVSLRIDGTQAVETVNFVRAGRTIIVQNPGKSYVQRIGVYKDNEEVHSFELDRYVFFAGSIPEIITSFGNPSDPIESEPYTLQGDGEFEFRIRTGRPPFPLSDNLSRDAFISNLVNVILDHLDFFLPNLPSTGCMDEVQSFVRSEVAAYIDLSSENPADSKSLVALIFKVSSSSIELIETLSGCSESTAYSGFLGKLKKFVGFLDKVSNVSQTLNDAIFIKEFLFDPAATDTCFYASGEVVSTCGGCGDSTSVTDIDGNEYPIVQIGDQCWTAENLKTTRFADGSVIPNVTSVDSWINLSTPAWCNYENSPANDITYGKLYNWFTVADPRNVCPTGWHVPTDAEWTVLTDYLGGQDVAGGKMKTTSGWQSPNTGATNESGFSGLPGGFRYDYGGDFGSIGYYGYWWSSSESSASAAWYRFLFYNNDYASRNSSYKQGGFSVRCLRD